MPTINLYIKDGLYQRFSQEKQKSVLIQQLLEKYYEDEDLVNLTEEQRQREIKKLEIIVEAQKKVQEING